MYHASKHYDGEFLLGAFNLGYAGVDIFFVLSGFVIALSQNGKKEEFRIGRFLISRFARIYPSYWVFLFIPLAILGLFLPNYSPSPAAFLEWDIILTFLLFFGHPVISQVTWTLSYELFFYTIFGVLFKFKKLKLLLVYAVVILILLLSVNIYKFDILKYIFNPIILEFLGGVSIFHFLNRYQGNSILSYFLLVLGFTMFLISMGQFWGDFNQREFRFIFFGLPAIIVIYSLGFLETNGFLNFNQSILTKLGDASYVMYLIHSPILSFTALFLPIHYYQLGMIGMFVGVSFLSLFLFNWVDKPLYIYLKRAMR